MSSIHIATTAAARRQFDRAMSTLGHNPTAARVHFEEATDIDPSMAGRVARPYLDGRRLTDHAAAAVRLRFPATA